MSLRFSLFFLVVFLFPAIPAVSEEQAPSEAASLFEKGGTLLKEGDVEGSMNAYMAAARAEPGNKEYSDKALLIRRVVAIRRYVAANAVSDKWKKMVLSLHSFYLKNGVHSEALKLDRMAHEKLKSALSGSLLVETLLELQKNAEALAVLKGLDKKDLDLQNRLYFGITLARLNRIDDAIKVRQRLQISGDTATGVLYDFARLDSLLGNEGEAIKALKLCFEKTPPSSLDLVKGFVKGCVDFKPLAAKAAFSDVMKTKSKIKESDCSGGTSCSTCPKKAGCSSSGKESKDK